MNQSLTIIAILLAVPRAIKDMLRLADYRQQHSRVIEKSRLK